MSDYGNKQTVKSLPVQVVKTLLFMRWCLMFIKHYQEPGCNVMGCCFWVLIFQRHGCCSPWHPILQPRTGAGVGGAPLLWSVLDSCAAYCKTEILSLWGSNSFFCCDSEGIVKHKAGAVIIFCLCWFPLYVSSLSCAPFPFMGHCSFLRRKDLSALFNGAFPIGCSFCGTCFQNL